MTTSQSHSLLSEPVGDSKISAKALGYVSAAARLALYEEVLEAFQESKLSQAVLAKRLDKRPEQISRLLAGPGNWTVDTAGELLFAIDGSLLTVSRRWPERNRTNKYFDSASSRHIQSLAGPSSNNSATNRPTDGYKLYEIVK